MRYVRFMGPGELRKYQTGETLENHTDWKPCASTSKGFCFFTDDVPPEERMRYLSGIADMQLCCVFEPIGPLAMKEGTGRYRDVEKDTLENILSGGLIPTVQRKEYSVEQYSKKTLKLIAVGDCNGWERKIKWRENLNDG